MKGDLQRWQERYAGNDVPWDTGRPSGELLRVVAEEKIPPGLAIDLGCGTGTNAVWLAQQRFDVTAVDISPLAIERARARAAEAGAAVRFLLADLLEPPDLGGPYDFFFDRGCYHVVRRTDVGGYLETLKRITRPGSVGLVLAGNAKEPGDPGPPVVTEEEIRQELGRVFEIASLREFRFDQGPQDNERYLGWSCLIRRPR